MKILVTHRPGGAFGFITDSWINAFKDKGHEVSRWDGIERSWYSFEPDLYLGCSGHKQPIPPNHNAKIAIHVNPYGPIDVNGINEQQQSKDWVISMKPDIVFGYGFDDDSIYWKYWKEKLGIPWCPMPTAGDKTIFNITTPIESRSNGLIYIGGRWSYKATSIDKYLLSAIRHAQANKHKVEVYGWGDWPPGISRGQITNEEVPLLFNKSKIGPCISEPHTQMHGFDLPERFFKVSLCGLLPIHDPVPTLKRLFPDLPMAQNVDQYVELCNYYLTHDAERINLAKKINSLVLNGHTYHHRLSRLLRELGFVSESHEMLN